jgi:hypothetical protein
MRGDITVPAALIADLAFVDPDSPVRWPRSTCQCACLTYNQAATEAKPSD